MTGIVEGLRGNASQAALDIGLTAVMTRAGAARLLTEMEKAVFPEVEEEAKDLYRVGARNRGNHLVQTDR